MSQNQPFNPDEFAKWLVDGVKDTLQYRIKQTLNKEQLIQLIKSKIPTRNQVFHKAMRAAFEKNGFTFEVLQQGDAPFHVIRKKFSKDDKIERRLIMIPGFGDTPTSWVTTFAFCKKELEQNFDEMIVIDFPGYLGFLSHTPMVPSMEAIYGAVRTICEANPPTTLIGHSLGGSFAGKFAQESKRPIDQVVLIAPSGLPPEDEKQALQEFVLKLKETPFEDMIKKIVHQPRKVYMIMKNEFEYFYSKPEIKEFVDSVKPEHFIDPKAPFMCKELTVVWGDEDQFVPSHWMRHWVECFGPYMDGYFITHTGHLPQIEHPKTTADLLRKIVFNAKTPDDTSETRWKKISSRTKKFNLEDVARTESSAPLLTHTAGYSSK